MIAELAGDALVDLRVVDDGVDALAVPALEHAADLRRAELERHADEIVRRLAVGAATASEPWPSGSAISTSRASTSSRSRRATSVEQRLELDSPRRARSPISLSDSSWRSQRVDDSYRRAFSIATAACAASSCVSSSSSVGEVGAAGLLGQVEVAVGDAPEHDRDAEERLHRRVVAGEPDRARVVGDVVQPQRLRVPDQHAEDAAPARQVADRRVGLGGRSPW